MSKASTKAYIAIRERILSGDFPPGFHLKEEQLADVCGVSRTPIRDALRKLAADDFVRAVPNHGTYVSNYSDDDIGEIFALRAMLEGYAARLAAERAGPEHITEMRAVCADVTALLAENENPDRDAWLAANSRFHDIVTEAAASERLSQMISRLIEQPVVVRTAKALSETNLVRSNRHHIEVVDAIEAGEGDWASMVMSGHILAGYQTYKDHYRHTQGAGDKAANLKLIISDH